MRSTTNIFLKMDDFAKLSFGETGRWLDLCSKSAPCGDVALFFPDDVPVENVKAIENAINDALEIARASFEAKVEAQIKVVWGERHEQKEVA